MCILTDCIKEGSQKGAVCSFSEKCKYTALFCSDH